MLEPETRYLLFDALRPPDSYELDRAVGTTYSLDLTALLFAPLTFALFDQQCVEDDETPDPLALLEAVRRHAERIHLFCQAGQIGIPRRFERVLTYLEDSVIEATPPDPLRIFHPKVWVLRFRAPEQDPVYRLLCLSRNLTFDRSWDTILCLDGHPRARGGTPLRTLERRNRPLTEFVRALPDLAVKKPLPEPTRRAIGELADELLGVEFELPQGMQSVAFWPLGHDRQLRWPFQDASRLLVVSPFVGKGTLNRLAGLSEECVLVSRAEALDELGSEGVAEYGDTYVVTHAAGTLEDTEEASDASRISTDEAVAEGIESHLQGLHAKLYVADSGHHTRIFTGSANATDAAFSGNVEFLVELQAGVHRHGVRSLLSPGKNRVPTFGDLLERHEPSEQPAGETVEERLERRLDEARRALGGTGFRAGVEPGQDPDTYAVELHADAVPNLEGIGVRVWPITVKHQSRSLDPSHRTWRTRFESLSFQNLTSFFALELTATQGGKRSQLRFAVNATLTGAPHDRRERLLADMLNSRQKVLRYLLFLLAGEKLGPEGAMAATAVLTGAQAEGEDDHGDFPLLEAMIRALARDPQRIDHIGRLIHDLRASGRADELLPEGLEEVWESIWAVHLGRRG